MLDWDEQTTSYTSRSGYRIWGGNPRPVNEKAGAWFSFAVVLGAALAFGGWYAFWR